MQSIKAWEQGNQACLQVVQRPAGTPHSFAIRNRVIHFLLGFMTGWITSQSDDCALSP